MMNFRDFMLSVLFIAAILFLFLTSITNACDNPIGMSTESLGSVADIDAELADMEPGENIDNCSEEDINEYLLQSDPEV